MFRWLYRCLLVLHPPAFRRRFGTEMLSIFEEAAEWAGAASLLADGFVSAARQWILRSGAWKWTAAAMGACVQVVAGGLILPLLAHRRGGSRMAALESGGMEELTLLVLGSGGAVVVMVAAVSQWFLRLRPTDRFAERSRGRLITRR